MLDYYFTEASRKLPFQEHGVFFRNFHPPYIYGIFFHLSSSFPFLPSTFVHLKMQHDTYSRKVHIICKEILIKLWSALQYVKILESDLAALFLYLKYKTCFFYAYFLSSNLQLVDL